MTQCTATPVPVRPAFDLQRLAALSRTLPPEGPARQTLAVLWDRWLDHLRVYRLECECGLEPARLLAWLEPAVERDMERAWARSPSEGYMLDMLAASLVMAAAEALIPELGGLGCAPVPPAHPAVASVARELGLGWTGPGALDRRYALATFLPYIGGCEVCALAGDCPRLRHSASA